MATRVQVDEDKEFELFLEKLHLEKYLDALLAMNINSVIEVGYADEDDLKRIQMNKPEIRRLLGEANKISEPNPPKKDPPKNVGKTNNEYDHLEKRQVSELLMVKEFTELKPKISIGQYKTISIHFNETLLNNLGKVNESRMRDLYASIISNMFYHLKCGLPFDLFLKKWYQNKSLGLPKTNDTILHSLFQQSDALVKALCIDDYSFNFPIPFYYPLLTSIHKKNDAAIFTFCQELWYTFPKCLAIASFGLGKAALSPVGKSTLLNWVFDTDFVTSSKSPFHLNSIDVQISKNFRSEAKVAIFDCHSGERQEILKVLSKHVNIVFIHVHQEELKSKKIKEKLSEIVSKISKHPIVLVRDSDALHFKKLRDFEKVFIPNLVEFDYGTKTEITDHFRKLFQKMKLSEQNVTQSLIQNVIKDFEHQGHQEILDSQQKINKIIQKIEEEITNKKKSEESDDFLSFYPSFVEYMDSHHKVNHAKDQQIADELNLTCTDIYNRLNGCKTSPVIDLFLEFFDSQYSPLLLRSLSEYLKLLNDNSRRKFQYSIEVIWREALLSYKYDHTRTNPHQEKFTSLLQECLRKHIMNGEPFELIDGDNLVFHSKDIDILLQEYDEKVKGLFKSYNQGKTKQLSETPIVISILGPQNSGKSTLLNYLFGCRFVTSSGRCTKGVYGSLFLLDEIINNSKTLLILDTEGLSGLERETSKTENIINFDRTLALFCLAVSQIVIVNIVGDIHTEVKNLLQVCAYSLNRLKVNKVTLPKILFVLNQQADPNLNNHTEEINRLLESLECPIDSSESEIIRVSHLIQMSHEDLTILPSAFNSSSIDSPFCDATDLKPVKYVTTEDFLMRCTKLKNKIFDTIKNIAYHEKPPFENIREWIQMSGLIWETCVKYQDIVMYRAIEEIIFSQELSDIYHKLMGSHIYQKHDSFLERIDILISETEQIKHVFNLELKLIDKMQNFDETYVPCKKKCAEDFMFKAKRLPNFEQFDMAYNQALSNLNRLIFNNYRMYEAKLKFRMKYLLIENKLIESMKLFKIKIEPKLDDFINMSEDQKLIEFVQIWDECCKFDSERELINKEEDFANLYANFKMECNFIETRLTILTLFRGKDFNLDEIIKYLEKRILEGLKDFHSNSPENWYFCTLNQSYGDLKKLCPHITKENCLYLTEPNLLTRSVVKRGGRDKIAVNEMLPIDLHPIVKSCSGDYNNYENVWGTCPERIQILCLVSLLKKPNNPEISCWNTLMGEVKTNAECLMQDDRELSQTTIKKLVNSLHTSIRVVNHEIRYIRAMLSDRAERELSTLLFSYAFRVFLDFQDQRKLDETPQKERTERMKEWFLQKIENRKMFKGDWDTKNMNANDLKISRTFALSYIEGVKRLVFFDIQIKIEKYFENKKETLIAKTLLSKAKEIVDRNLNDDPEKEIADADNFVIRFICKRNDVLEEIFHQHFDELTEVIKKDFANDAREMFESYISPLEQQLQLLQEYFDELPKELIDGNGQFSDYHFKLRESLEGASVRSKEMPFRAMSLYLSKYLNPTISPEELSEFFKNDFEIEGIKVGRSDKYKLPEEKYGESINFEEFRRLENTDIFKEYIFNIYTFIENFRKILHEENLRFSLNSDFTAPLFKELRSKYLKDAMGCDMRCPSCGKFCEKPIHNDGSKCQISNGHQLSSMGGKVWKNDAEHTAVLFMCDDYQDFMDVKLPGKTMKWKEFKTHFGTDWNWDVPYDPSYEESKEHNQIRMQKIWTKYGRGILNYYSGQEIHISFIPISLIEMKSISTNYFICFLIDGTGSMHEDIKRARLSVAKLVKEYQNKAFNCNFKVVIYRDHCDDDIIETCPNDKDFSQNPDVITEFLDKVAANGGGDEPEAMLDGFATAICKTDWANDKYARNILVHIFDAPPHGNFPNYKQHRSDSNKLHCCCCNHGSLFCLFDWDEHVWNSMKEKNIFYHGINTSTNYNGFEITMKSKLGELCGKFEVCGKEQVDETVLQIFVDFHI